EVSARRDSGPGRTASGAGCPIDGECPGRRLASYPATTRSVRRRPSSNHGGAAAGAGRGARLVAGGPPPPPARPPPPPRPGAPPQGGASGAAGGLRAASHTHGFRAVLPGGNLPGVVTRLRAGDVEPLLMKGPAIARHYAERGLRPFSDLDLAVRPDQYRRTLE